MFLTQPSIDAKTPTELFAVILPGSIRRREYKYNGMNPIEMGTQIPTMIITVINEPFLFTAM